MAGGGAALTLSAKRVRYLSLLVPLGTLLLSLGALLFCAFPIAPRTLLFALKHMNSPKPSPTFSLCRLLLCLFLLSVFMLLCGCGGKLVKQTSAEPVAKRPARAPLDFPAWLGNRERNFYGTGPWEDGPLEVIWENETGLISGQLHKDGWGGVSWPGQPSVAGERVYFPSADGNVYCLNAHDGT